MKEINIAATLLRKRKERGITQEELAHYIGVSKASVSKWETGVSFPDIAFLPQLATYFDISIDELMGYNPQMTKENIRALYQRLSAETTAKPFADILAECRTLAKEYYSCYPLLVQLGQFLLNHSNLLGDNEEARTDLTREIIGLFERVQEDSKDFELSNKARSLEAYCYLGLNEPDMVLTLLEGSLGEPVIPTDSIAAGAYQIKGETEAAKRTLQIALLQNVTIQMSFLLNYLSHVIDDKDAFHETVKRTLAVSQIYKLESLHPTIHLNAELSIAIGFAMRGEIAESIEMLERYAQTIAHGKATLDLHGDEYFNLIDDWLEDLENGAQLPRNASLVKDDLIDLVSTHPAFTILHDQPAYQAVVNKLKGVKTS